MSTPAVAPATEKIHYEPVTEKDSEEILILLKKFFFKDEPLNTYLDLGECKELELYSTKCIKEKCSFKALNSKNEIVGVFLNGLIHRPKEGEEPVKLADGCEHKKFRKIMGLMDYIDTKFNLFDLYPDIDVALDGKILSVDSNYRGMGISVELTNLTIEHMRQNNIPLMHVLCSSHFSARVMEKLDFEEVFRMPYTDYLDSNGEQILCPAHPHVACRTLVKRIIPTAQK
ncbi:arylalkylamine N-acetyltransferase 1 isoform X2 [Phlebotomus papatasi]|nr:arylalkylamine N-acetyltransferase 1 isoform X2 [Phlebotomus papatasi]XP_055697876.1 arylalkylamine N-acetyltransferase 1 isoform X2 [Phlebotomus papatasi]XP_055697877.1 arylalkylamine N-acetyltransferase 1 isoform X2 [Phlebotomus papatasi]